VKTASQKSLFIIFKTLRTKFSRMKKIYDHKILWISKSKMPDLKIANWNDEKKLKNPRIWRKCREEFAIVTESNRNRKNKNSNKLNKKLKNS
jgi:hypothetical protein